MSRLAIYDEQGSMLGAAITGHTAIAAQLQLRGVRFEQCEANRLLSGAPSYDEALAAYSDQVQRLTDKYGFKSIDVVSIRPDNHKRDELRARFIAEHTHGDFEVRFFEEGRGHFYLHVANKVYLVLCEQGDLIRVPAHVVHWFDMGSAPDFKCIRLFVIPDGWVAQFTESNIHRLFPDFDQFVSNT